MNKQGFLNKSGRNAEHAGLNSLSLSEATEQLTLNQRVQGSGPCAPTNVFKHLDQI